MYPITAPGTVVPCIAPVAVRGSGPARARPPTPAGQPTSPGVQGMQPLLHLQSANSHNGERS